MTLIVMALGLIVCAMLQSAIPAIAVLGEATVPAVQALVLYYALVRPPWTLLVSALAGGVLLDSLSLGVPLGVSTFCFAIAGVFAARFRHLVFSDSFVTASVFGAGTAVVIQAVTYLMLWSKGLVSLPVWWVLLKVAGSGVLAAVVSPLIFAVMRKVDRMVGNIQYVEDFDGEHQPI